MILYEQSAKTRIMPQRGKNQAGISVGGQLIDNHAALAHVRQIADIWILFYLRAAMPHRWLYAAANVAAHDVW